MLHLQWRWPVKTHRHTAVCYSMPQHHIFPFSFIGSFPCGISTTFVMSHRIKVMLLHLQSYAWCRTTFWPLIIPISCKVVFYLEVQIGKQTTMYRHHQGYIMLVWFGEMHSGMPIDNNVIVIDRDAKYSLLNAHILLLVYFHRKHHWLVISATISRQAMLFSGLSYEMVILCLFV